jgi:prepilin-type N-terminal cleavage/methylation domain-containing protein
MEEMMPASKKIQAGFTLVELLVAIVVLAIGLLGLVQLQVTAIKTNSQSMTSTAAKSLAQKAVEEFAATPPEDPIFVDGQTGTWGTYTEQGGGTYTITYSIAQVKAPPGGNDVSQLFNITVTVTSTTDLMGILGNKPRIVTMNTLKRAI